MISTINADGIALLRFLELSPPKAKRAKYVFENFFGAIVFNETGWVSSDVKKECFELGR